MQKGYFNLNAILWRYPKVCPPFLGIQAERRANLLLIAAFIIFALWLVGLSLKGTATERQIRVNSNSKPSPYSVIFLGKIACRYVVFELPDAYLELAQALLVGYFEKLEEE